MAQAIQVPTGGTPGKEQGSDLEESSTCWVLARRPQDLDKEAAHDLWRDFKSAGARDPPGGVQRTRVIVEAALSAWKVVARQWEESRAQMELPGRCRRAAGLAAGLAADRADAPGISAGPSAATRLFDPDSSQGQNPPAQSCWQSPAGRCLPSPGTCSAAASDWPDSSLQHCWRLLEDPSCSAGPAPCSAASARRCRA